MNDQDFIAAISVADDKARLALTIRRVIARWCHVPAEEVLPSDHGDELHQKMSCGILAKGWDETGFLIMLEDELGKPIDMKNLKLPPFANGRFFSVNLVAPSNLGLWIREAIPILQQHLTN